MSSLCRPRRGFTLIELLTTVAVIGILAGLSVFAVGRARESAKRAACASNLRQIGNALTLYANEHKDRLPDNAAPGVWAWDVKYEVIQLLGPPGDLKDIAYCPSGEFPEKDILWEGFKQGKQGGFRAIGYVLLLPGTPSLGPESTNPRLTPQPYVDPATGQTVKPEATKRELAVDASISIGFGNFTNVQGMAPTPHRANHIAGDRPSGGNILFLDNHVEWRPFAQMKNHVNINRPGVSWFWW